MPAAFNHRRGQQGPSVVGYTTAGSNSTTTLTPAVPTGVANGDLLLAFMGGNTSRTWTGDTGWTERIDQGALPSVRVATKTASGESGNYTFTASGSLACACVVIAFRGAAYDAIGSIVTRTGDGDIVVTGFTSAGGMALMAVYTAQNIAGQSAPSGYTEIAVFDGNTSTIRIFQKSVGAGATASATTTISGTSGSPTSGGVQIGVKNG